PGWSMNVVQCGSQGLLAHSVACPSASSPSLGALRATAELMMHSPQTPPVQVVIPSPQISWSPTLAYARPQLATAPASSQAQPGFGSEHRHSTVTLASLSSQSEPRAQPTPKPSSSWS